MPPVLKSTQQQHFDACAISTNSFLFIDGVSMREWTLSSSFFNQNKSYTKIESRKSERNDQKCKHLNTRKKEYQQLPSKHRKNAENCNFLTHQKNVFSSRSKKATQPFRFYGTIGMNEWTNHPKVTGKKQQQEHMIAYYDIDAATPKILICSMCDLYKTLKSLIRSEVTVLSHQLNLTLSLANKSHIRSVFSFRTWTHALLFAIKFVY